MEDAIKLVSKGTPFTDEKYKMMAWSGHKDFQVKQDEMGNSSDEDNDESDVEVMEMEPPAEGVADAEEAALDADFDLKAAEENESSFMQDLEAELGKACAAAAPPDAVEDAEEKSSSSSSSSTSSSEK
jgi:hypothetical protein